MCQADVSTDGCFPSLCKNLNKDLDVRCVMETLMETLLDKMRVIGS